MARLRASIVTPAAAERYIAPFDELQAFGAVSPRPARKLLVVAPISRPLGLTSEPQGFALALENDARTHVDKEPAATRS